GGGIVPGLSCGADVPRRAGPRASSPWVGPPFASPPPPLSGHQQQKPQDKAAIDKPAAPAIGNSGPARAAAPPHPAAADSIAAVLAWLDGIGQSGLDGHDLRELGLKDGT